MAKKKRSWAKWTTIALVVLIGLPVGAYWGVRYVMALKFYPDAPVADYSEPRDLAEAQAQDLDYFTHYFELEKSYTPEALGQAGAMISGMKERAGDFTRAEFDLAIGEVVALADNGHSNAFASVRSRRFGRIDIRTTWFDDGLYVLRATEEHQDLLGARLISVSGVSAKELEIAFRRFYGGTLVFKKGQSNYFIEAPELLEGAGLPIKANEASYFFQLRSGEEVERVMSFGEPNPDEVRAFPHEWMNPAPLKGEGEKWSAFLDPHSQTLPLYLKHPADAFFSQHLPNVDAYYIQLRQNYDSENQKIGAFLKHALKEVEDFAPRNVILDMRHNGGGDYTTTAKYMWKLPELVPADGRIFLISSGATFSAGMSSMGFVKEKGGDRVTIVGTEPGDRMQFWSEGSYMTLPNSEVVFRYSTGYVDMQAPCDDYSKCYWLGALYPIEVDSLSPDVEVALTFADYTAERDPVMDWILAELGSQSP